MTISKFDRKISRLRLRVLPAVLALGAAWLARPALPTYADNSLITTSTSITWTHGPFVVANPTDHVGPPNCTAPENFGQNSGVKYAPAVPLTTISTNGTYSLANNTITIFVPESGVGSPSAGTALNDLQARTFAGQANATTVSSNLAVDSTGFGSYTLVPASTCS